MCTSIITIILVSIVIPAGDTVLPDTQNYRVREVVGVLSANSFQCKLEGYKPAPSVRFQVFLPDAEEVTKETLSELLKPSNQIELRNVEFRSYFRLEADVWIDGQLFLKKRSHDEIPQRSDISQRRTNTVAYPLPRIPAWQRPQLAKQSTPRNVIVQGGPVTIGNLLETQVDCSPLSDESTLSEALTFLSKSVHPRLPLLILWRDLEYNAAIGKDTPIGVSGLKRTKLRQALNIIARSVSAGGPRLVFVKGGGLITLGTAQTLLKEKSTRVYDVRDLMAPSSTGNIYHGNGFGNSGFGNTSNTPGRGNRSGYRSR